MRYLERILGANAKNNSPVTYIDIYNSAYNTHKHHVFILIYTHNELESVQKQKSIQRERERERESVYMYMVTSSARRATLKLLDLIRTGITLMRLSRFTEEL